MTRVPRSLSRSSRGRTSQTGALRPDISQSQSLDLRYVTDCDVAASRRRDVSVDQKTENAAVGSWPAPASSPPGTAPYGVMFPPPPAPPAGGGSRRWMAVAALIGAVALLVAVVVVPKLVRGVTAP